MLPGHAADGSGTVPGAGVGIEIEIVARMSVL